jgi:hypothetical protein
MARIIFCLISLFLLGCETTNTTPKQYQEPVESNQAMRVHCTIPNCPVFDSDAAADGSFHIDCSYSGYAILGIEGNPKGICFWGAKSLEGVQPAERICFIGNYSCKITYEKIK